LSVFVIVIPGVVVALETEEVIPVPLVVLTLVTVPALPDLLLNVVQSAADNAPLFKAEAVGTFKVITAAPVLPETVLDKLVPDVPNVKAATLVTVPVVLEVPAPIAVLKALALNAVTLSFALNLGKVIAPGGVSVNIDLPIVVAPKLPIADVAEEAPVPPLAIDKTVPDQSLLLIAKVPPSVTVPVVVIVPPVNVKPFIVPAVATDVTPDTTDDNA
jgi:hypothetical protein